jgi:23S rRNA (cytidine1920-2'-O)/16S rRNA (cytidine1409-2'-O)-methyltransferase
MSSRRLDRELVVRGLARSRAQAQQMIAGGHVLLDGELVRRAAEPVSPTARIEARPEPYVSRAAYKLLGALDDLGLTVTGRALDAGASTGGFTQVLLERGCHHVIAIDVGTDQLVPLLRSDPRVTVWEQTNLRQLTLNHVDHRPVDLVVADVSFISLTLLIGPLTSVTAPDGRLVLLVKPQFEVGRERLAKGGVVRSAELQQDAVRGVTKAAESHGWPVAAVMPSRLPGSAGNQEFFVLLDRGGA